MAKKDHAGLNYVERRSDDGQWVGVITDAGGRRREFKHKDRTVVRISLARHLREQAACLIKNAEKIEKQVSKMFGPGPNGLPIRVVGPGGFDRAG